MEQWKLTDSVWRNTELLDIIIKNGIEMSKQRKWLDETKQEIHSDENAEQRKLAHEEKEKIKNILKVHAKEIETLKAEINLYKRKGGHIYTKVTSRRTNMNNEI